jgi:thioredoxin 1
MTAFTTVDDSSFQTQVLHSNVPVLVEFGAVWCGPCRQLEPILENVFQTWDGKIQLVKIDIDQSVDITLQYQVMSVPTLILFIDGHARQRVSGKQPRDRIIEKFFPFLEKVSG